MKTYTQLKEEAMLDEGFLGIFGDRQTKDIEKRVKEAAKQGPEAEAEAKLDIIQDLLKGLVGIVKGNPKAVAVGIGVILADLTIASTRRDMYMGGLEKKGIEFDPKIHGDKLPKSVSGRLVSLVIDAVLDSAKNFLDRFGPRFYWTILGLIAAGFSLIGIYKLFRMLVVRGPDWLDALITTRDERTLAYTLKKEFDTDVYTQSVRLGSPGQGRIGVPVTSDIGAPRRGRPPINRGSEEAVA